MEYVKGSTTYFCYRIKGKADFSSLETPQVQSIMGAALRSRVPLSSHDMARFKESAWIMTLLSEVLPSCLLKEASWKRDDGHIGLVQAFTLNAAGAGAISSCTTTGSFQWTMVSRPSFVDCGTP